MTICSNDTWHIFYKDVANDDPLWHLYDDFIDAPVFKTRSEASDYLASHKDEFSGCITRITRYMMHT